MPADIFQTIESPSAGIFKDKGSKFLSFAYPVFSLDEIKKILADLRKKYHDARHFCYAYILGTDKAVSKDSDDGEPSNTAGKPIMRQLHSKGLTNILIVVVRYFGGILLGTGGLIKAYGSAASDALNNSSIISMTEKKSIIVNFEYSANRIIQKIIKEEKLEIVNQNFGQNCSIIIKVRKSETEKLIERLMKTGIIQAKLIPGNEKGIQ